MTNKEWLEHLAHNDIPGLAAWFDAEHVETEERALDGDTAALNAKIAELEKKLRISWEYECKFQDERDELQAQVDTLQSRHCPHYDATEHTCDVHETRIAELTAERDNWKEHSRTIEYRCKKAETDCEIYRKKFGKCIDYADAIHALMDDEGMA